MKDRIIDISELEFVAASHENKNKPGSLKKVIVTKEELGKLNIQMINWAVIPPKSSFKAHYHEDLTEIFIFVSGNGLIYLDGVPHKVCREKAVIISPRTIHKASNSHNKSLTYLVIGLTNNGKGKTVVADTT